MKFIKKAWAYLTFPLVLVSLCLLAISLVICFGPKLAGIALEALGEGLDT